VNNASFLDTLLSSVLLVTQRQPKIFDGQHVVDVVRVGDLRVEGR